MRSKNYKQLGTLPPKGHVTHEVARVQPVIKEGLAHASCYPPINDVIAHNCTHATFLLAVVLNNVRFFASKGKHL